MRLLVGTSGYSYKEWKGVFYPEKLAASKMLAYYADHLDTVEINNTFYRMPKKEVVAGWAEQTREGFQFCLKATQRITHKKRLADAEDEIAYVTTTATELGEKLGPMLFQLPPWLKKGADRLKNFLEALPDGWRAAIEFRHESWFDDEIYNILRARDAALVISDTGKLEAPVVPTAPYGYLRLRREKYDDADLEQWAEQVKQQPWEETHVFFKHEDECAGPVLAQKFKALF